jgi:hypothetical protein
MKYLPIIIIILILGVAALAQESFTITVTVNYIDFSLRKADDSAPYDSWEIGNLDADETTEMSVSTSGTHILVDNQSNVALDFDAYSTSATPTSCEFGTATAWSPDTASGADIYLLEMGKGTVSAVPDVADYHIMDGGDLAGSDNFYSAIAGDAFRLYSKLTAPTTVSDGCEHSITVYVVATTP